MSFFSIGTAGTSSGDSSVSNDVEVRNGPTDSISALAFSPVSNHLAAASWDAQVRIYEIDREIAGKAAYTHEGPVLDVCWSADGLKVLSGGVDNAARVYDVQTSSTLQVAQHEGPVRNVRWSSAHGGLLATGSWDKTLKYWDLRAQQPVASINLEERCYGLDISGELLVTAQAERKIQLFDLRNPAAPYSPTAMSPLKFQTRSLACFPDQAGYAIGSIEGRVAIQYIDEVRAKKDNFSYKCHRGTQIKGAMSNSTAASNPPQLFSVNSICFHPTQGTFATAGSDGTISFWDKTNKTRLKSLDVKRPGSSESGSPSVTATAFNHTPNATIFAYAVSYDWARGHVGNTAMHPNRIMLHASQDDEVKERPKG